MRHPARCARREMDLKIVPLFLFCLFLAYVEGIQQFSANCPGDSSPCIFNPKLPESDDPQHVSLLTSSISRTMVSLSTLHVDVSSLLSLDNRFENATGFDAMKEAAELHIVSTDLQMLDAVINSMESLIGNLITEAYNIQKNVKCLNKTYRSLHLSLKCV